MDKKVFNRLYAKYQKKDYFSLKMEIRTKIKHACPHIYPHPTLSEIKNYLKKKKEQAYNMIIQRIAEYNQGKTYPKRERFTWACINATIKQS